MHGGCCKLWSVCRAWDTVSEGIEQTRSALREANQPGPPAPYSRTRLTVLDNAPFEGRRAQTGEDNQARGSLCLAHVAPCTVSTMQANLWLYGPPLSSLFFPGTACCTPAFSVRAGSLMILGLQVKYFKQLLLYCVAGLDRGFAANEAAGAEVERAVGSLQNATSPVVLSWTSGMLALLAVDEVVVAAVARLLLAAPKWLEPFLAGASELAPSQLLGLLCL